MSPPSSELCLLPAFMLVSRLAYSSTLKIEAICSSETSVDSQWTKGCYTLFITTAMRTSLFMFFTNGRSQQDAQWIWSCPLTIIGCVWVTAGSWLHCVFLSPSQNAISITTPLLVAPLFASPHAQLRGQVRKHSMKLPRLSCYFFCLR
jgi:hypothetical protein